MKLQSTIFKTAIFFACTFIFTSFTSSGLLHAQCDLFPPNVVTPQYFCPGATVANLQAQGINIKWYLNSSPTEGEMALSGTFPLDNGVTYWASQSNDVCESYRSATTVIITTPIAFPPLNIITPQHLCAPATLANVEIPEETIANYEISWYETATSPTPLDPATTVIPTSGGTYYAGYTNDICMTVPRQQVNITVVTPPAVPTIVSPQTFCLGEMISNIAVPSNQIRWYAALTGGSQLAPSTILSTGTYYATQSSGSCESTPRVEVQIVIYPLVTPVVAIAADPGISVCTNTEVTFTATPINGGSSPTFQWKKGGVDIGGATSSSYKYTPANGDVITCVMTSNATCPSPATVTSTNSLTMNVYPDFKAGAITTGSQSVSHGSTAPITISNSTDAGGGNGAITYEWYKDGVPVAGSNHTTYDIPIEDRVNISNSNLVIVYTRKAKDATCETTFVASVGVYTLTVYPMPMLTITSTAGSRGFIDPEGATTLLYGDNLTFTFGPNTPYRIEQVLIDGVNDEDAVANGAYTFANVTANHTIEVTFACPFTVEDLVNNDIYNVVTIDGICWIKENLRAKLYQTGEKIPFAKPYYHALYPDVEYNEDIFGLLYDWYSATGETRGMGKGICPDGWRLPTSEEFALLNNYPAEDLRSKIYWLQPHHNTNITGFDSRGAGFYNSNLNRFEDLYGFTAYWSSDASTGTLSTAACLTCYCNQVEIVTIKLTDAISVRCVAND